MPKNYVIFTGSTISLFFFMIMLSNETGLLNISLSKDENFDMLILMSSLIMVFTTLKTSETTSGSQIFFIIFIMYTIFALLFLMNNMFSFYILFELSVVPLMFFVTYWGYSLERVKAMFYMFLYTFSLSIPFLMGAMFATNYTSFNLMNSTFPHSLSMFSPILMFLMMCFMLVKMPMWTTHLWLMKAHVEASTEGSMLLASIVLKLSGVALIKMPVLFSMLEMKNFFFSSFLLILSIFGAILMAFYTMRQSDIKLIVAVSSIIHMSFMLTLYFLGYSSAVQTLVLVMVSHGLVSPLMFLFIGVMYEDMSSRNGIMIKGALKSMFLISMLWFLMTVFNMAVPLTMNFLAEILFFFNTMSFSYILCAGASLLIFLNGLFNIYLFTSLTTGKNKMLSAQYTHVSLLYSYYSVLMVVAIVYFFW